MWPRELFALSWAVLALGVAAGQRNPSKGGGQPARSWNRRAFDMLQGKVVCQRQAGPGWGRHPLGKGETDCSLWGSAGRSGQARSAGEKRDFMARARARGCLGKWEREMVRNLLADLPPPTYSRCGAEQGALRRNFKQRFHLHLLHQVIAMPLIQVSWKEAIELEFQTPAGKEALTKVKLYGTFLVFFLDEEKDWLPHQERNFSISIKKGRWSKHEDGCHLGVWGLLAVIALALIASLVMNFIYCASTRHQVPRPIYRSVQELQSPVVQEVDDYPIYGNLIQDNAVENESCYEAMTSTNRCKNETQVAIENQMCYASLDLSMKQKRRHQKIEKKTNSVKSNMNVDNLPTHSHMLISKPRIYLNSGQINHNEGRREEPIQNEPFILYGEINTSHSKLSISDTSMTFDNTINY